MRESNLSYGRGRLAFLKLELAGTESQVPSSERDGARGHQNHFLAALSQGSNVRGQALKPSAVQSALVAVHQQGGPDFDDDSLCIGQATGGGFAVCGGHGISILPFT